MEIEPLVVAMAVDFSRANANSHPRVLTGPAETMGELIRKERKAQGLTLEALSDLTSLSRSTLTRFENGHHLSIGLDILMRLARALGVSLMVT